MSAHSGNFIRGFAGFLFKGSLISRSRWLGGTCAAGAVLLCCSAPAGAQNPSISNPPANRRLSSATLSACQSDPAGASCTTLALADVNAARASEGVAPMVLPSNYASLTLLEQVLVVADLERTGRHLTPILGHAAPLDADAARGAVAGQDPSPTSFNGDAWGSNWEGGYASPLEADFVWMYDDGPGSDNVDCTAPADAGCWGHRQNIISNYDPPLVMGIGYTPTGVFGSSMTELFVGGDEKTGPGQPDAPLTPPGYMPTAGTRSGSSTRPQGALRISGFTYGQGRLVFTAKLVRGKGTVRATASRAGRTVRLHVVRHKARFKISGALSRGMWTVQVVLVAGPGWRGRSYVIRVQI